MLGGHKECDSPGRGAGQGLEVGMSSWRCDKRGEVTQGECATRVGGVGHIQSPARGEAEINGKGNREEAEASDGCLTGPRAKG